MHTFLFADLVGFTALSLERGDEEAADVATRFQREVAGRAARHGATVVKSLGDGAMVRAGDAADALRLGLELATSLEGLPPVRVGLNTGPAVERDGDWFGSTVNLAARLSAAARGGEALVSQATRDAARRSRTRARLEPRGPRLLRSTPDPIVVYAAAPPMPWRERLRAALYALKRQVHAACPRQTVEAA
jgi:class 3 adenylate cyclase